MDSESSGIVEESGIFKYTDQEKMAKRSSRVPVALVVAAATVIILAGIKEASVLIGPALLALFITIILLIPLRWLQDRGCPKFLAFLIVMFCTIALFIGIMNFIRQSLTEVIIEIPKYKDQIVEKYAALEKQLEEWGFAIDEWGKKVFPKQVEEIDDTTLDEQVESELTKLKPPPKEVPPMVVPLPEIADEATDYHETDLSDIETAEQIAERPIEDVIGEVRALMQKIETDAETPLTVISPQTITYWLARVALYARDMLGGGLLVLLFTIFMLLEASHFPAKLKRAFGEDGPLNMSHFHKIAADVRHYLFLKTVSNLMSGAAAMGVYYWFKVPGWFFWGIVAFFMYYIPNLGGTLAAVIPGILIFMTQDAHHVLLYALCLLTVECVIAYGIEPKLLGHGLHLPVIIIILSLFFWGFLLGPIGLFLAAPLAVVIKIVLQAFPETRWLAIFLDAGREKK